MPDANPFFAAERAPPYYAVSFSWVSVPEAAEHEHQAFAAEIYQRAATIPGFIGSEWIRDADGCGIASSFWETRESLELWTDGIAEIVKRASTGEGGPRLFADYVVRVINVERAQRLSTVGPIKL